MNPFPRMDVMFQDMVTIATIITNDNSDSHEICFNPSHPIVCACNIIGIHVYHDCC